jgi:hypothetical protein
MLYMSCVAAHFFPARSLLSSEAKVYCAIFL